MKTEIMKNTKVKVNVLQTKRFVIRKSLIGKKIRVRGWLEKRGGPMIEATHPEQLEFLD